MIDLGYMAKRIVGRPDWLDVAAVREVYSVSDCVSENFCDYVGYWMHNGFWFFDTPAAIQAVADAEGVPLSDAELLYYRGHPRQYEGGGVWSEYSAEDGFRTEVEPPASARLLGYDVAAYSMQNAPECSPLSCNGLAARVDVNEHCLMRTLDYAIDRLQSGAFDGSEPGPYRIIAVYAVEWP